MNKAESKYFSTAVKMDEAFLSLIEKKDFSYITIKEICERAGVNRSTFYLHYESLADLLEESTQYIIDQFVEFMPHDTSEFLEKMQDRPLEELYLITPEYLSPYLTYVKKHRRLFLATIQYASVLGMDHAYAQLSKHVFYPILNRYQVPLKEQKYIMSFFIHGIMAIINEWLKEDCKESVDNIVSLIQTCIPKHYDKEKQPLF